VGAAILLIHRQTDRLLCGWSRLSQVLRDRTLHTGRSATPHGMPPLAWMPQVEQTFSLGTVYLRLQDLILTPFCQPRSVVQWHGAEDLDVRLMIMSPWCQPHIASMAHHLAMLPTSGRLDFCRTD
jgi:hypothetical protein